LGVGATFWNSSVRRRERPFTKRSCARAGRTFRAWRRLSMKLWPITALGPPGEIITWTEGLGFGHGVRTLRGTMSAFAVQWDAVSKVYANGVGGLDTLALDAPAGEIL